MFTLGSHSGVMWIYNYKMSCYCAELKSVKFHFHFTIDSSVRLYKMCLPCFNKAPNTLTMSRTNYCKKKGNQMERNCLWKGSQLEKKQCKLCASRWAGAEFPLLGKHKDDKEVRQGTLVLQPLFYELHFFNFGKEILGNYDHLWWSLTDILVCSYYKLILQNDLYLYIWYAPMGQARCHVFILVWQISWEELGI